jgi:hypothetical protein
MILGEPARSWEVKQLLASAPQEGTPCGGLVMVKDLGLAPLVLTDLGLLETNVCTMNDIIRLSYPAVNN